jgi:hypothetical protein
MTKVYVVIETADIELLSVRFFASRADAGQCFDYCLSENQLQPPHADLSCEVEGTIMLAGDDSYAVQVIEGEVS